MDDQVSEKIPIPRGVRKGGPMFMIYAHKLEEKEIRFNTDEEKTVRRKICLLCSPNKRRC